MKPPTPADVIWAQAVAAAKRRMAAQITEEQVIRAALTPVATVDGVRGLMAFLDAQRGRTP